MSDLFLIGTPQMTLRRLGGEILNSQQGAAFKMLFKNRVLLGNALLGGSKRSGNVIKHTTVFFRGTQNLIFAINGI